jgi:hypothetical protein
MKFIVALDKDLKRHGYNTDEGGFVPHSGGFRWAAEQGSRGWATTEAACTLNQVIRLVDAGQHPLVSAFRAIEFLFRGALPRTLQLRCTPKNPATTIITTIITTTTPIM